MGLGSRVDYLGLYGRYFHGQDYYNLSFTHLKQNALQIGFSFTPGRSRGPSFPTLEGRVLREESTYTGDRWKAYRRYIRCNSKAEDKACELPLP